MRPALHALHPHMNALHDPWQDATGGAAFKPTNISGCVLWLRADKGVTLGTGSGVLTWADQSGNGNDFTQTTAVNQPTFVASGINGLSSLATVAATSQSLFGVHNASAIITTSAAERFLVGQSTTGDPPAGGPLNSQEERWGNTADATAVPFSDGLIYDQFGTNSRKNAISHTANLANPYIYNSYSQASDWRNFINGTLNFSTGTNTFAVSASPPGITGTPNAGGFSTGTYSEWVVYNRVLTTPERLQVTRYLGSRYAITVP